MIELDLAELLPKIILLAQDAGFSILAIYETAFAVTHKLDNTPVTAADLAAHRIIRARLATLTPDIPQICEESPATEFAQRAAWKRLWLIDPLDGTREFIKRNGEFTVNIALIEDHIPILGVIHAPVTGVTYFAARGLGAHKKTHDGTAHPIHVRSAPPTRIVVAGSRSHAGSSLQGLLAKLGEYDLVEMGSSLKSCLVA
ncbi:MAG: 3'(2'),5'-bisphosphate nucleotidase CysQ, partial [Gammaproteobacteria bacterium]|nr:3'(2'),5'-bisphosphate nucleotidase CysQ [Gammaproteobacteria bacterium]